MGTRLRVTVRIGTSGWSYDHWNGVLYPTGTSAAKRLAVYVGEFDTVELNASFYRWPKDTAFESWRQRLPDGFTMAVKAHRGLTHYRRLRDPEPWVERFERAWRALGGRAEALLIQLHPALERDDALLARFLAATPDDIRLAVEFRHPTWHHDAVLDLLERHGASYVVTGGAGQPFVPRATASLVYVRLHGPDDEPTYAGSYRDGTLRNLTDRIGEWRSEDRDVVVYFNNDLGGHAVRNARTLQTMVST